MRTKYKNQLFHMVRETGIPISSLDFEERNNFLSILRLKNSPLYFNIHNSSTSFDDFYFSHVPYRPDFKTTSFSRNYDFSEVLVAIENWLINDIKNYIEDEESADLWKEFNKSSKTFSEINFEEKELFSEDEKVQLTLSINELKHLIHTELNTNETEQALVIERLDYLIAASNRLSKFDWKSVAISTLISISIALTLDSQKGHLLFELFKKVFKVIPLLSQ